MKIDNLFGPEELEKSRKLMEYQNEQAWQMAELVRSYVSDQPTRPDAKDQIQVIKNRVEPSKDA